jgi:hypothetical protein
VLKELFFRVTFFSKFKFLIFQIIGIFQDFISKSELEHPLAITSLRFVAAWKAHGFTNNERVIKSTITMANSGTHGNDFLTARMKISAEAANILRDMIKEHPTEERPLLWAVLLCVILMVRL